MRLIKCGDHRYAPGVVVCVHLFEGKSRKWCRVSTPGQEMDDWLCPECFQRIYTLDVDNLRSICMHCARELRAEGEEVPEEELFGQDKQEKNDEG